MFLARAFGRHPIGAMIVSKRRPGMVSCARDGYEARGRTDRGGSSSHYKVRDEGANWIRVG